MTATTKFYTGFFVALAIVIAVSVVIGYASGYAAAKTVYAKRSASASGHSPTR